MASGYKRTLTVWIVSLWFNKCVFGLIDIARNVLVQYFIITKDEVLGSFTLFYNAYIMYVKVRG